MESLRSIKDAAGESYDAEHAISVIFTDGEKLYGINHLNGLVFIIHVTEAGVTYEDVITLPDPRGLYASGSGSNGYYTPIDVIKVGDWMLWHRVEWLNRGYEECLVAFNLVTGAVKQAVLPGLKMVTSYKDGKVLVCCSGTDQALYAYDPQTDMSEYLGILPRDVYVRDIAYSDALDMILYQDFTRIMGWSEETTEQLGYIPTTSYATMMAAGDTLLYTTDEQRLTACTLRRGYSTDHSLSMMGGTMYTVLGTFAMSYQDVPVYYMNREAEETYQQVFAREQDAPDLVYLSGTDGAFTELMAAGSLMDLSAFEDIQAYTELLYPAFKDFVTKDGGIYGVPVLASSYNGWFINKEVMKAMGLTAEDIPTSLTELCEFATKWNDEYAAKYPHYTLLNNTGTYRERILEAMLENWSYYCQYHGMELTYDHPIFREMLAALDAAELSSLDAALKQTDPEVSEYKQALIWTGCRLVGNWGSYMEEYSDRIFIPLTLTPETPFISAVQNLSLWTVNEKSDNAEYAAALLAEIIRTIGQTNAYILRTDMVEPIMRENYEEVIAYEEERLAALEARLEDSVNRATIEKRIEEQKAYMEGEMKLNMYEITPSSIEQYTEVIAPASFIYTEDAVYIHKRGEEIYGCIKSYIAGEIKAEAFITRMNELLASQK